jgi:hypothetical protein
MARVRTRPGRFVVAALIVVSVALGMFVRLQSHDSRPITMRGEASVQHLSLPGPDAAAATQDDEALPMVEPTSPRAALSAFLDAEVEGRSAESFRLLVGDVGRGEWIEDRLDRLVPASYVIEAERGSDVDREFDVLVRHVPHVDTFAGFVPATSRQTWRVVGRDGRFRVEVPAARVEYLSPSDSSAAPVVRAWLAELEACRPKGAAALQIAPSLFGRTDLARQPCRQSGWTAGEAGPVRRTIDIESFAAAYGPDVATWARLVPVDGPSGGFFAVVAPLGDAWRVLGVTTDLGRQ